MRLKQAFDVLIKRFTQESIGKVGSQMRPIMNSIIACQNASELANKIMSKLHLPQAQRVDNF